MLKEFIYTGIGVATIFKQKVETEIKKLEAEGKIRTDDAKSFLESLEKKGQEEDAQFKEHIKETIKEVIDELGLATKADLDKLKEELK